MRLVMKRQAHEFFLQFEENPNGAYCGRGPSLDAAIADFVRHRQADLGIEIVIDKSAMGAEIARRLVAQQNRHIGPRGALLELRSQPGKRRSWLTFR